MRPKMPARSKESARNVRREVSPWLKPLRYWGPQILRPVPGGVRASRNGPSARVRTARLDVEVTNVERVLLDELATGLDLIAHEHAEELVGTDGVAHAYLQERPGIRAHGRFPELVGV